MTVPAAAATRSGELTWWLLSSNHGGVHRTLATDPKQAREQVRQGIAEAGMAEGLSRSAARRYAHGYGVEVIAGWCTEEEVAEAAAAWDDCDDEPANRLRERYLAEGGERRRK